MANDGFFNGAQADRQQRRVVLALERKARTTGKWAPWERLNVAPGEWAARFGDSDPRGWGHDVHSAYRNGWASVLVRTCNTAWGLVHHAAIATGSGEPLTWKEQQRIKDDIFGPEAVAVEVHPARSNLVDAANMYHLWVLPIALPFGLGNGDPCSEKHYRPS